jgi:hypothetical protein
MTNAPSTPVDERDAPLTLAELIDLEVQLAADLDADPAALVARDSAIGEAIGASLIAGKRHATLRAWLVALGASGAGSVGRRVQGFYRIVGWGAAGVSLCGGAGTAAALLRYDGRDPVNIINFLAVLVGLQLLLIILGVFAMLPAPWRGRAVRLSGLQEIVRDLGYRRAGVIRSLQKRGRLGAKGAEALGRLAALHGVYAGVERWSLTVLTQRAAVAFNLGALAVCLYLVTVRALAFAWSTTLEIDPELMTRFFRTLATPWQFVASAVPDRDLVEVSRYFPGRAYDADRLGDWWPFLFAALATYGLLPRVGLAMYASYRQRAARRALALDHGECALVYARLLRSVSGWGPGAEVGAKVSAEASSDDGAAGVTPIPANVERVHGVRWAEASISREETARLVAAKYSWSLDSFADSVGDGGESDAAVLARLGADRDRTPVLLIAEAWEPPSKNFTRFLRSVRSVCGDDRALIVGLLTKGAARPGPSPDDARIWRRRISALGDARIRVEALDS